MTKEAEPANIVIFPIKERNPSQLFIHFIPRYVGDNIIIQIPYVLEGELVYKNIMIDSGGFNEKIHKTIRKRLSINEIHHIILTHGDSDHVRGLNENIFNFGFNNTEVRNILLNNSANKVLENPEYLKKVKESLVLEKVYLPNKKGNNKDWGVFIRLLEKIQLITKEELIIFPSDKEKGLKVHDELKLTENISDINEYQIDSTAGTGQKTSENKKGRIQMFFNGPDSVYLKSTVFKNLPESEKVNDASLIFSILYNDKAYLFTGDAGKHSWKNSIPKFRIRSGKSTRKPEHLFLKLPHHGSKLSFPDNILGDIKFVRGAMAVATRHLSNRGVNNIKKLHPIESIISILTNRNEEKKILGLMSKEFLHKFDHDKKTFKEKSRPFYPFLYTYMYDLNQDHLIGYRFFLPKKDISQTFLDDHTIELEPPIKDRKTRYYLLKKTQHNEVKNQKIIKVLSLWVNKQIAQREATLNW